MSRLCLILSLALLAGLIPGCERAAPEREQAATPQASPTIRLLFTYGSEKEAWLKEVTQAFNTEDHKIGSGDRIQVEAVPTGSGDCIDEILSGARQPHLTSPASGAYFVLGNAQSLARAGKPIVEKTDNLLLSPVVIAMWKPMAEALGWGRKPIGWSDILALAKEPGGWAAKGHPEWGSFKFGHTHPESSNSGLISLFAEVYAASGKTAGLTQADVARPEVANYVAGIEKAVVHYGSSTGFFGKKMFAGGPGYLSAAVLYENMVVESYGSQNQLAFPVVAIYPKEGTFWSDHPVGVVEREWVTPQHREAAQKYIEYLLARPQQEKALPHGFRPADPSIVIGAPIDAAHGVDPKEPQTTLEVPGADVMEAILALWRENKKSANVVLVLDNSGSMNADNGARIINAKAGAEQLVNALHDSDLFSMLVFSHVLNWSFRDLPIKSGRDKALFAVRNIFADGGTALYDAVYDAHTAAAPVAAKRPDLISAIVVLTDGEDQNSKRTLDDLLRKIQFNGETNTVRVFTIRYGGGSPEALKKIADATQGKYYEGTPQNIRSVFRDIATFF